MPLRIRKSVKIAPGIRLNAGKRGTSLSIGGRGNTLNVGKRGVRHTVGIPGTGISYTTSPGKKTTRKKNTGCGTASLILLILITAFTLITHANPYLHRLPPR